MEPPLAGEVDIICVLLVVRNIWWRCSALDYLRLPEHAPLPNCLLAHTKLASLISWTSFFLSGKNMWALWQSFTHIYIHTYTGSPLLIIIS